MTDPSRRVDIGVVSLAVLIAAYTGVRLPNSWTATLQSVSVFDGFHRRFLVGTVLRPLALATHFHYRLFATFSFIVLAVVIAVIGAAAVRTRSLPLRLVIVAWFVFVGGFLFDEVGYLEQVLYVMLFASIWLVHRGRLVAAVIVMSAAPLVHELALFTVLPLFGLVLLRRVPLRTALIATAIPAAIDAVVLLMPPASQQTVWDFGGVLGQASFHYRLDALALFTQSLTDNWQLRDLGDTVEAVMPTAAVVVALFVVAWRLDRGRWLGKGDTQRDGIVLLASAAAIAAPALLVFGGWDSNRWLFLVIGNLVAVLWVSFESRSEPRVDRRTLCVIGALMLIVSHVDLWYFDRKVPRELNYPSVREFASDIVSGKAFKLTRD